MMVTVRVKELDNLTADDLENFSLEADEKNKEVLVYHEKDLLGSLIEVSGIDMEDFLIQANKKG